MIAGSATALLKMLEKAPLVGAVAKALLDLAAVFEDKNRNNEIASGVLKFYAMAGSLQKLDEYFQQHGDDKARQAAEKVLEGCRLRAYKLIKECKKYREKSCCMKSVNSSSFKKKVEQMQKDLDASMNQINGIVNTETLVTTHETRVTIHKIESKVDVFGSKMDELLDSHKRQADWGGVDL